MVYPGVREVHAYTPPSQVRAFLPADDLDGGDVLPGFRVNVAGLFPPVADPPVA